MNHHQLAAPGGGPDLPLWGQALFLLVFAAVAVSVITALLRARRR
ncbi:hypothetical protein ACIPWL_13500 [Streptomyces sp. NPDC090023]